MRLHLFIDSGVAIYTTPTDEYFDEHFEQFPPRGSSEPPKGLIGAGSRVSRPEGELNFYYGYTTRLRYEDYAIRIGVPELLNFYLIVTPGGGGMYAAPLRGNLGKFKVKES